MSGSDLSESDVSLPSILAQLTEQTLTSQQAGSGSSLSWSPTTSFLVGVMVLILCVRRAWRFYLSTETMIHLDFRVDSGDGHYHCHHEGPWPQVCVTMRELSEKAEELDIALGRLKTLIFSNEASPLGPHAHHDAMARMRVVPSGPALPVAQDGCLDISKQWRVIMIFEEQMMRIQETILNLSLEAHDREFQSSILPVHDKTSSHYPLRMPFRSTLSLFINHIKRIRTIVTCYRTMRRLRMEILVGAVKALQFVETHYYLAWVVQNFEQMSRREQVRWTLEIMKLRRSTID
ncbi:hypothetical protein FB446DRAFT_706156 [Lentinula raphanica]|nr:hypothetical protein FB446DRAFT_706156 [Lentinula raphanica]KAJ3823291.1 hypothetical protein F5880DRAFT_1507097 [Lentinula raphanica]